MIHELVNIGEVVRRAAVFNFKRSGEQPVNEAELLQAVEHLFLLLDERKIGYVLVGGLALLTYIEGRNTEDIALIVALADLQKLPEITIIEQNEYFAQGRLGELKIDFLLTRNPLFQHVQRHYVIQQQFAGRMVRCANVAGLLLLKLYALPSLYRQGNFARVGLYENDIATLIQVHRSNLDELLAVLSKFLNPTDLTVLNEIVADIEQRIARFNRGLAQ